jgi:polyhydroxyalkanoate synthase
MVNQIRDSALAIGGQAGREAWRSVQRARNSLDVLLDRNEPEVGLTPKDAIYSHGTLRLYRYRPQADELYRVPVVFVMSLVSKPYILDLAPGQSFVEYLLRQGFDVYMMDWGIPRPQDRSLRLESYALELMPRCVEEVQRVTKEREVSFLGYCMGGLLSLLYASAFANSGLKNIVAVASPVDFSGMKLMRAWADARWFDVDRLVDTYGNVPAEVIRTSLELLRPLDRPMGYVRLWDNLWDRDYVFNWRIRNRWANDQIPFPGECYRQMVKELLRENKLMTGELMLGGRRVDLRRVTCSVLNAIAQHDHIAPFPSTQPLLSLVGSEDKQELLVKGGHVSLIAGKNAILRLWPTVSDWLAPRSI